MVFGLRHFPRHQVTLVELPRLKLTFEARPDHRGETRLYSSDHADLFVTNDRHPAVVKMLQGIPHRCRPRPREGAPTTPTRAAARAAAGKRPSSASLCGPVEARPHCLPPPPPSAWCAPPSLLLSNLKGELQLLVPVLSPVRPRVASEPFSTMLVMDRGDSKWWGALASRYYMYPVHGSTTFLLTKGINAALYLLLLRLLHRDYDDAYRLTDSVATDAAFNAEGAAIFKALAFARGDHHPDAHAVRLKVDPRDPLAC